GHRIHIVSEVLPGAGHAAHVSLAAQFSFRTDFARDAGNFRGEGIQLVHHGVDGVLEFEDLTFYVYRDLLGKIAVGHRGGNVGDVADLAGEIAGHKIYVISQVFPRSRHTDHLRLTAKSSFGTDFARHTRNLRSERAKLVHHRIDRVLQLQDLAFNVDRDFLGEIAVGHGRSNFRDITHLAG